MPDKIEPALSEAAWKAARAGGPLAIVPCSHVPASHRCAVCEAHARIAIDNDLLPDSDPRKITREWVDHLRHFYKTVRWEDSAMFKQIADALESYLPRRTP